MTTIGLLHPEAMGTAVGAALRAGGARVLWASQGRRDSTRTRAHAAAEVYRRLGDYKDTPARLRELTATLWPRSAVVSSRQRRSTP